MQAVPLFMPAAPQAPLDDGRGASRTATLEDERSSRRSRALMLAMAALYIVAVAALALFARQPMPSVPAIASIYGATLLVTAAATAYLLFTLALASGSRAILALGCTYLFSVPMAALHPASFPGALLPGEIVIGTHDTATLLFLAWKIGFPLGTIAVVLVGHLDDTIRLSRRTMHRKAVCWAARVGLVTTAIALISIWGGDLPPATFHLGGHYSGWLRTWLGIALAMHGGAILIAFALTRGRSTLHNWMSLVLLGFAGELVLILAGGSVFTIGWYAGRLSGIFAASMLFLFFLSRVAQQNRMLALLLASTKERARALQAEIRRRENTERHAEMMHSSRSLALGELAGSIAHELNQPLSAIANYMRGAQRLLERELPGSRAAEAMDKAASEALRAGEVIARLRELATGGATQHGVEDLPALVAEASALALFGAEERGVAVRTTIDPSVHAVLVDRVQIQQVMLNLIRNALEAMAGQRRRELEIAVAAESPEMAHVSIADTGPGVSPEIADRLFHSFASTKGPKGMGMGLAICRTIVESHGGRIWATAREGGGAVFHFTLPRAAGDAPP